MCTYKLKTFDICTIIYWLPQIFSRTHQQLNILLICWQPLSSQPLVLPPALHLLPNLSLSASVPTVSVSSITNQSIIYVNTFQYQIILIHGCVKCLGHQFGSSSLLTIFGCVSNPFSAQPWSCGSSAWRHCVSVDPYGAEHREGGMHSPLSTSYTYFTRLGLWWDLGSGCVWGDGENGGIPDKYSHTFNSHPTSKTKTKTGGSGFYLWLVWLT